MASSFPPSSQTTGAASTESAKSLSGNYTISLSSDLGTMLISSDNTGIVYSLPAPTGGVIGQWVDVIQGGSGQIQFQPQSGVSLLNFSGNSASGGLYAKIRLWAISSSSWLIEGTTAPGMIVTPISIAGTPPNGTVGQAYTFTPSTANGSGAKSFSLTGTLPSGLSFSSSTGALTGTPTVAGTTNGLSITVSDSSGSASLTGLSIVIGAAALSVLTLSPTSSTAGSAYSGAISGKTAGSTVTASASDGTSLTVSGTTVSGTFASAGTPTISLTETLAGASGSPKTSTATITVSAASGGLLLDGLSASPKLAYSTRKLRAAYLGSAASVTRSLDNTSQNIGFVSNSYDTASEATFVGSGTGTINSWYDQSTNSLNASQATIASQPISIASGTGQAINGKRAFNHTNNASQTLISALSETVANFTFACVFNTANNNLHDQSLLGSGTGGPTIKLNGGSGTIVGGKSGSGYVSPASSTAVTAGAAALLVVTFQASNGTYSYYLNGTQIGTGSAGAGYFTTAATLQIANDAGFGGSLSYQFVGQIAEVLFFDSVLASGDLMALHSNVSTYWGTP